MVKKSIERLLRPIIKNEEDRTRLSTVIVPSFLVRSGYFVLQYLILIVLTRTMGPARYGVFSYSFTIITLLTSLSSYGFEVVILRFTSSYLSAGKIGLWMGLYTWSYRTLLFISTAVAICTALFIGIFIYTFHLLPKTIYTFPILVCCCIIPVYSLMSFYVNLLRGQNKSLISFLPDNTVKPLFLLITLVAARLLLGRVTLPLAIGLNLASFLVAFIFIYLIFHRVNDMKRIDAEYDKKSWKKFVGSLFILTCVSSLYAQLDVLILGSIKDASQVGIYRVADRVAGSLMFFLYVMNMIIAPSIARLNTPDDKENLQKMITRTIRWVMLFSLPVFVILILFSGQIMQFSGPQFFPGKSALIIICCGQLINIGFGPVSNFALMTGNEKYNTIYWTIGIFINIALNLILTPAMGFNGTAIATSSTIIFWNVAMFITIKKKTGIRTWIFG
jgi:O-antigen/teichoic acid export membrane protein